VALGVGAARGQTEPHAAVGTVVVEGCVAPTLSSPKQVQPILDTPQTVSVMSHMLLDEQGCRTLRDSLRNPTVTVHVSGARLPMLNMLAIAQTPIAGGAMNIAGR